MLPKELIDLLRKREFVSVATADFKGRPNAAPKFILRVEARHIYLVDYTIGTTWENLRINPRISISLINTSTLRGYQLNGRVRLLTRGALYDRMRREMMAKEVKLTAQHIIDAVRGTAHYETFEILISEKFVVFDVSIDEVVEMDIHGRLKRSRRRAGKNVA